MRHYECSSGPINLKFLPSVCINKSNKFARFQVDHVTRCYLTDRGFLYSEIQENSLVRKNYSLRENFENARFDKICSREIFENSEFAKIIPREV